MECRKFWHLSVWPPASQSDFQATPENSTGADQTSQNRPRPGTNGMKGIDEPNYSNKIYRSVGFLNGFAKKHW